MRKSHGNFVSIHRKTKQNSSDERASGENENKKLAEIMQTVLSFAGIKLNRFGGGVAVAKYLRFRA